MVYFYSLKSRRTAVRSVVILSCGHASITRVRTKKWPDSIRPLMILVRFRLQDCVIFRMVKYLLPAGTVFHMV